MKTTSFELPQVLFLCWLGCFTGLGISFKPKEFLHIMIKILVCVLGDLETALAELLFGLWGCGKGLA